MSGDAVSLPVAFKGLYASPRMEVLMPAIHAPTLVIRGREDGLFPVAVADLEAAGIAGARKVILEKASHFPQIDQPEAFIAAVSGFLH
jgi:triacylglycerol lipase